VSDPGIFQRGGVPPLRLVFKLLFWVFKGGFHSQNALFLPILTKFSDEREGVPTPGTPHPSGSANETLNSVVSIV
jgi:hypothetical protein